MQDSFSKSAAVAVLSALVQDELSQLRQQSHTQLKGLTLGAETRLTLAERAQNHPDEVLIDSFEWMALATRVVNYFCIESSGIEDYLLRRYTLGEWADIVLRSRQLASTDIRFQTSGSTGPAQTITHQFPSLQAEANHFQQYLTALPTPAKRIVSLVPAHHIYGFLFSVLLPEVSNWEVVRGLRSFGLVTGRQLNAGDVVIAFPSFLQELAKRGGMMPKGVTIVCSTGPCPQQTLVALQQQGVERVIEVYGSTDTSGIGMREQPDLPYKLLPRWRKHSDDTLYDRVQACTVEVPDQLEWIDDHNFRPCGRKDGAIMVNGNNVFPQRIAMVLAEHPEVLDARVRLLATDNSRGLKALIVVDQQMTAIEQQHLVKHLKAYAAEHLSGAELPQHYTLCSEIPRNAMGKEVDWEIEHMESDIE